jgi:hypothetical protein
MPQGDAHPRTRPPQFLRDRVLPGVLARATHDQQIPAARPEPMRRTARSARPQQESPPLPQRHRGYQRIVQRLPVVVTVPGHAVATVPVQVDAHRVELDPIVLGERRPHRLQRFGQRPGGDLTPVRHHPRFEHHPVVHSPLPLPPRRLGQQPVEQLAVVGDPPGHLVQPGPIVQPTPHQPIERQRPRSTLLLRERVEQGRLPAERPRSTHSPIMHRTPVQSRAGRRLHSVSARRPGACYRAGRNRTRPNSRQRRFNGCFQPLGPSPVAHLPGTAAGTAASTADPGDRLRVEAAAMRRSR